jgi:hypothetical protein
MPLWPYRGQDPQRTKFLNDFTLFYYMNPEGVQRVAYLHVPRWWCRNITQWGWDNRGSALGQIAALVHGDTNTKDS